MKILFLLLVLLLFVLIGELIFALQGKRVANENPSAKPQTYGTDMKALTYLIIGDSTGAGIGADYADGIAVNTAKYLARDHKVQLINLSVSGAKTSDVLHNQVPKITNRPDVVLIAVGSNDVTHVTSLGDIGSDFTTIVDKLVEKNCDVKIVVTGAGAVNSAPRFVPPLSWIVQYQVKRVNGVIRDAASRRKLTFAPIAEKTGPIFLKDRTLFAPDHFHPNAKGYTYWTDVINSALDDAMTKQPSHCTS